MAEIETTTIAVKKSTASRLDALKIHPNQSFEEVISSILDKIESKKK